MTTTVPDRPATPTRPSRTSRLTHVGVEFTRTPAAKLTTLQPPAGLTRTQLAELARLESRVLDHLARNPAARAQMLENPASVLKAAVPDAPGELIDAVAAVHARAPRIPAGLRADRFAYGIEGRVPLPALALGPQPTAAPNSLGGFDACLAVGGEALGRALGDQLGPLLTAAIAREFTVAGVGTLRIEAPTFAPAAAIGADVVTATATAGVELTLLGGSPVTATLTIEIDLSITAEDEQIVIDLVDVRVTSDQPLLDPFLALVATAARSALQAAFPLTFPVDLPGSTEEGICDIGLRDLGISLMSGTSTTQPCLGLFTSLLPDAVLDPGGLASPLPTGAGGGLFLDNFFLLRQIACAIQDSDQLRDVLPQPTRVPERTDPTADQVVAWDNLAVPQTVDGNDFLVTGIDVRIVPTTPPEKRFDIGVRLRIERRLFTADVELRIPVTLELVDGKVVGRLGEITHSVKVRLTVLGWIVAGALVLAGAIIGGILAALGVIGLTITGGAVAGGGIAAVLVIGVVVAIKIALGRAAGNAEFPAPESQAVIPQAVLDLFGVLDLDDLFFDDLALTGTLTLTPPGLGLDQTVVRRASTEAGNGPDGQVFNLATTVRFDARPHRLVEPVGYEWRFRRSGAVGAAVKGTVLATGSGPAGSGIASVAVAGNRCTVTSASGADVDGTVSVRATDAAGRTFGRGDPLELDGSMTVPVDDQPDDKPDPIFPEQP